MRKRIGVIALLLPLLLLPEACQRERWEQEGVRRVPDGEPVTLTLGFGSTRMTEVDIRTKSEATPAEEARVHDLYIMLFDASGDLFYGRYFSNEQQVDSTTFISPTNRNECWYVKNKTQKGITPVVSNTRGAVKLSTVSKSGCKLVALANIASTLVSMDDLAPVDRLNDVETYAEMGGIIIKLKQDVIDRKDIFLMMGELDDIDSGTMNWTTGAAGYPYNPSTRVDLQPLDAKVTFRIKVNKDYISAVTPKYWQVYSAPKWCYLSPDANGGEDPAQAEYFDSGETYFETTETVTEHGQEVEYHCFTFYMLENRKHPLATPPSYYARELQDKDDDPDYPGYKKNGEWTYSNKNSTYVKFDLVLTLTPEGIQQIGSSVGKALTTDAIYTVHLGDFGSSSGGSFGDYNTLRGHDYTYTITVNNSTSIYAEVMNDNEVQPAQEGFLLLTNDDIINCDAHYEVHRMVFTANPDLDPEKYSWYIKTPFGSGGPSVVKEGDYYRYPPDGELDYKWVKFALNEKEGGVYKQTRRTFPGVQYYDGNWKVGDSGPMPDLIDVSQLVSYIVYQNFLAKNSQPNDFDTNHHIVFSAFIDEFYYEQHPFTGMTDTELWREFVNAKPRELHILSDAHTSKDRKSDVIESSHSVIQQSIQTIYNIYEPGLRSIWGTEHTDEMKTLAAEGWPFGTGQSYSNNMDNGRLNTAKLWGVDNGTKQWSTYLDYSVDEDVPELSSTYQKMLYSCLTRNRDNDGDGDIDGNEVRWYLASIHQLIGTWVGNEALSESARPYRPVYDASDPTWWHAHVVSSSCKSTTNPYVLTAEEGVSYYSYEDQWVAAWDTEAKANKHQSVRCMRNVGTFDSGGRVVDLSEAPFTQTADTYYQRTDNADGTYSINFHRLNPKALRTYSDKYLPMHMEDSPYNRVYLEIVAQNPLVTDSAVDNDATTWPNGVFEDQGVILENIEAANDASLYCPTGYRLPNQRELAVMTIALPSGNVPSGYWNRTYAWMPTCTLYSRGKYGDDSDKYQGRSKLGWVYSNKGIHIPTVGEKSRYVRCVRDYDLTGTIMGQLGLDESGYCAGDRINMDFKFSSTESALTMITLTLCYEDSAGGSREVEIPVNRQPTGLQYNTTQYYTLPSLSSLGIDPASVDRVMTIRVDLLNAAGKSMTVTKSFDLKATHLSNVTMDLLTGKASGGYPIAVTASSTSATHPLTSLRLYSKKTGDSDFTYEELLPEEVKNYSKTLYRLPTPEAGKTYTYYLEAHCYGEADPIVTPAQSMTFYRVNFSPGGSQTWVDEATGLDFSAGDFIESRITLSPKTNTTKEGLFSIGNEINSYNGSGYYVFHIYYQRGTVGGITGPVLRTSANYNGTVKASANKSYTADEVDLLFNQNGYYVAGSLTTYVTWASWENLNDLVTNLTARSSLKFGQLEGSNRSWSTYQYIRSVHKNLP